MTALLCSNGQLACNVTKIELVHSYFYRNFEKVYKYYYSLEQNKDYK